MSDEAKVAYLQEKIHEARRNQIIVYVVTVVAVGLVSFLLWRMAVPEHITFISGLVAFLIGSGVGDYYGRQKRKLMEELKGMAGFTQKPNE